MTEQMNYALTLSLKSMTNELQCVQRIEDSFQIELIDGRTRHKSNKINYETASRRGQYLPM